MLLLTFLSTIPNHRRAQGRRYRLKHVLFVVQHSSDPVGRHIVPKIQCFIAARLPPS